MDFTQILKQTRKKQKMTQQVLAERVGVSTATISYWEKGTFAPTDASNISALEIALNFESGALYKYLYGNPTKSPLGRERAGVKEAV